MKNEKEARKKQQLISYLNLRMLIGATGFSLPFLLVFGCFIYGGCDQIQDSISDYYHTGVRDIFVGVLFVLGFFLLTYKGYEAVDSKFANLGFVFALGVALCPTQSTYPIIRNLHFLFATLLFAVFTYFALVLFRKMPKDKAPTENKKNRNNIYLVCGIIMVICILGIILGFQFLSDDTRSEYNLVFWLETIALLAFGASWLVKGELILRDVKNGTS